MGVAGYYVDTSVNDSSCIRLFAIGIGIYWDHIGVSKPQGCVFYPINSGKMRIMLFWSVYVKIEKSLDFGVLLTISLPHRHTRIS